VAQELYLSRIEPAVGRDVGHPDVALVECQFGVTVDGDTQIGRPCREGRAGQQSDRPVWLLRASLKKQKVFRLRPLPLIGLGGAVAVRIAIGLPVAKRLPVREADARWRSRRRNSAGNVDR